jgi:hypothetical protein
MFFSTADDPPVELEPLTVFFFTVDDPPVELEPELLDAEPDELLVVVTGRAVTTGFTTGLGSSVVPVSTLIGV